MINLILLKQIIPKNINKNGNDDDYDDDDDDAFSISSSRVINSSYTYPNKNNRLPANNKNFLISVRFSCFTAGSQMK